jgi:hypothetical protein
MSIHVRKAAGSTIPLTGLAYQESGPAFGNTMIGDKISQ